LEKTNGPPDAHLVDEVHGGREEHHDPARGVPGARAAGVLTRQHDGDHGLPGACVEHRDGVPAQRRREHLQLVPARERDRISSAQQAPATGHGRPDSARSEQSVSTPAAGAACAGGEDAGAAPAEVGAAGRRRPRTWRRPPWGGGRVGCGAAGKAVVAVGW